VEPSRGVTVQEIGTGLHTVLVRWNPALARFKLAVDGNTLTVDPTSSAPVAGPANAHWKRIFATSGPGPGGRRIGLAMTAIHAGFEAGRRLWPQASTPAR
jgi:hypothetical protein